MCHHTDTLEDHCFALDTTTGRLICISHPTIPVTHDRDPQ